MKDIDAVLDQLTNPQGNELIVDNQQGVIGDTVDALQKGTYDGVAGAAEFFGLDGIRDWAKEGSDDQMREMSQAGRDAMSKQFFQDDENGNLEFGEAWGDGRALAMQVAHMMGMNADILAGGGAVKGVRMGVTALSKQIKKRLGRKVKDPALLDAAAKHGTEAYLQKLAKRAGAKDPKAFAANAKDIATKTFDYGVATHAVSSGLGAIDIREEVAAMDYEDLMGSESFKQAARRIKQLNPAASATEILEKARQQVGEQAASNIKTNPALMASNVLVGGLGGVALERLLKGVLPAGAGIATEFGTEAVQGGTEQYASNVAKQDEVDPNQSLSEGVLAAGLNEGVAGAMSSGVFAGGRKLYEKATGKGPQETPAPESDEELNMTAGAQEVVDYAKNKNAPQAAQPQPNQQQPTQPVNPKEAATTKQEKSDWEGYFNKRYTTKSPEIDEVTGEILNNEVNRPPYLMRRDGQPYTNEYQARNAAAGFNLRDYVPKKVEGGYIMERPPEKPPEIPLKDEPLARVKIRKNIAQQIKARKESGEFLNEQEARKAQQMLKQGATVGEVIAQLDKAFTDPGRAAIDKWNNEKTRQKAQQDNAKLWESQPEETEQATPKHRLWHERNQEALAEEQKRDRMLEGHRANKAEKDTDYDRAVLQRDHEQYMEGKRQEAADIEEATRPTVNDIAAAVKRKRKKIKKALASDPQRRERRQLAQLQADTAKKVEAVISTYNKPLQDAPGYQPNNVFADAIMNVKAVKKAIEKAPDPVKERKLVNAALLEMAAEAERDLMGQSDDSDFTPYNRAIENTSESELFGDDESIGLDEIEQAEPTTPTSKNHSSFGAQSEAERQEQVRQLEASRRSQPTKEEREQKAKYEQEEARIENIAKGYVGKLQGETGTEQVQQVIQDGHSERDASSIVNAVNLMEMAAITKRSNEKARQAEIKRIAKGYFGKLPNDIEDAANYLESQGHSAADATAIAYEVNEIEHGAWKKEKEESQAKRKIAAKKGKTAKAYHGTIADVETPKTTKTEHALFGDGLYLTSDVGDAKGYASNKTSNFDDEIDWNRDLQGKIELQAIEETGQRAGEEYYKAYTRIKEDIANRTGKLFEVEYATDKALTIDESGLNLLSDKDKQLFEYALVEADKTKEEAERIVSKLINYHNEAPRNADKAETKAKKFEYQYNILKRFEALKALRQFASLKNKNALVIKNVNKLGLVKSTAKDTPIDHIQILDDSAILNSTLSNGRAQQEGEVKPAKKSENSAIAQAANEAATSPTNDLPEPSEAQIEAGNYKKGHVNVAGFDISIENPKGSTRRGTSEDGKAWESTMQHHYGDIKGTKGADGDPVDVFIGDNPSSQSVYIVNQVDPKTGNFDEHKVMMGFDSEADATTAYQSNYEKGWKGLQSIVETTPSELKTWLSEGNTNKPYNAKKTGITGFAKAQIKRAKAYAKNANRQKNVLRQLAKKLNVAMAKKGENNQATLARLEATVEALEEIKAKGESGLNAMTKDAVKRLANQAGIKFPSFLDKTTAIKNTVNAYKELEKLHKKFEKQIEARNNVVALIEKKATIPLSAIRADEEARDYGGMAFTIHDVTAANELGIDLKPKGERGEREVTYNEIERLANILDSASDILEDDSNATNHADVKKAIEELDRFGNVKAIYDHLTDPGFKGTRIKTAHMPKIQVPSELSDVPNTATQVLYENLATLEAKYGWKKAADKRDREQAQKPKEKEYPTKIISPIGRKTERKRGKITHTVFNAQNGDTLFTHTANTQLQIDVAKTEFEKELGDFETKWRDYIKGEGEKPALPKVIAQTTFVENEADIPFKPRPMSLDAHEYMQQLNETKEFLPITRSELLEAITKANPTKPSIVDSYMQEFDNDKNQTIAEFISNHSYWGDVLDNLEAIRAEKKGKAKSTSTAPEHVHNEGKPLNESETYDKTAYGPAQSQASYFSDEDSLPLNMSKEDFNEITDEWAAVFEDPKERVITARKVGKTYITEAEANKKIESWKEHVKMQNIKGRGENAQYTVLSLFDKSGEWSRPYAEAGYNVIRFDIQDDAEWGDVMKFSTEFFNENFDIGEVYAILAACPCTDFASSGSKWFKDKDKDGRTEASKELVFQTMRTIEYFRPNIWALENPVGRIERLTGLPKAHMTFDPHHFGAPYTKKTMLWGNFNANLPTANVEPTQGSKMHSKYGGKSLATKNARSKTPEGFSYAFFMANNRIDDSVEKRLTDDMPEISGAIKQAVKVGMAEDDIREAAIEYGNYNPELAAKELVEAIKLHIKENPPPKKAPTKKASKLDKAASAIDKKQQAALSELSALIKSKKGTLNSGVDPEVMLAIAKVGGYTIAKGAVKFSQWVRDVVTLTRQAGIEDSDVVPHLKEAYGAITANPEKYEVTEEQADQMDLTRQVAKTDLDNIIKEVNDVSITGNDVEQAGEGEDKESEFSGTDEAESTGFESNVGEAEPATSEDLRTGSVPSLSANDDPIYGAPTANDLFDEDGAIRPTATTGSTGKPRRSDSDNDTGISLESDAAPATKEAIKQLDTTTGKAPAKAHKVKWGDKDDILKSVPVLLPEQAGDIELIEKRFFGDENQGLGYQNTNGTGTGKTFVGLGLVKRQVQSGKENILIVVPNDGIARQWVKAGKDFFDLAITNLGTGGLSKTKDPGKGVTISTYATLGQNNALINDRDKYDLIIGDESQNFMASQQAKETKALTRLRAITNHEGGQGTRARVKYADEQQALNKKKEKREAEYLEKNYKPEAAREEASKDYKEEQKKIDSKISEERERLSKLGQLDTKVLFLSATPWPYVKNLEYAEGYVFNYEDYGDKYEGGYDNAFHGHNNFYIQNFGYQWRYHKLNRPGADVDDALMERTFHENLKEKGVLGGRVLEVEQDYARDWIKVETAAGEKLDDLIDKWSNHEVEGDESEYPERPYAKLAEVMRKRFDYIARIKLTEAIKAEEAAERAIEHMKMGRKVVLFHSFNVGGSVDPVAEVRQAEPQLLAEFEREFPRMTDINFGYLQRPLDVFADAFGDKVRFYNGGVSNKERAEAKDLFNKDGSGVDVIVVQQDAGEAGLSLHDVTGKHQRVLINIGMPARPTQLIQIEGRTYRVGVQTDAHFEYLTTGTSFEREVYASKISTRASTAENLAMGEMARSLKESIAEGYLDAEYKPAQTLIGKGGKQQDRPTTIDAWDKAVSLYYANLKRTSKTKSAEGADYFATPEPLGKKMVEWAQAKPGTRTLEPSVGHGAIGRWFGGTTRNRAIEPSYKLYSIAQMNFNGEVINAKFEELKPVNKVETVVMNPPFGKGGKLAYDHIEKAVTHLTNGGRIVALVPDGPAANKRLDKFLEDKKHKNIYQAAEVDLPQGVFERAGTGVKTKIIILDRFDDSNDAPDMQRVSFTGASNVKELFERIKDVELRPRKEATQETIDPNLYMSDGYGRAGYYPVKMNGPLDQDLVDILNEGAENLFDGRKSKDGQLWAFDTTEQLDDFKQYAAQVLNEAEDAGIKLNFPKPIIGQQKPKPVQGQDSNAHFTLTDETYTTKRGKEYVITEMTDRQERETYQALKDLAKEFGGWARGQQFMFKTNDDAAAFNAQAATLLEGNSDSDLLDAGSGDILVRSEKTGKLLDKSGPSLTKGEVSLYLNKFINEFKGIKLADVTITRSPVDLYGQKWADDNEGAEFARGSYNPKEKRLNIFFGNIHSLSELREVLLHELHIHQGLGLYPPKVQEQILNAILQTRETAKAPALKRIWAEVDKLYSKRPELEKAEEVLAKLAQSEPADRGPIIKALKKAALIAVSFWRKIIAKTGHKMPLTQVEMESMLMTIGTALQQGKRAGKRLDLNKLPSDNDALFDIPSAIGKPANAIKQIGRSAAESAKRMHEKGWKDVIKDPIENNRKHWLGLIPRRYLQELAGKLMPSFAAYMRRAKQMDADRNELMNAPAKVVDGWREYAAANPKEARQLTELMHETTIVGIDPSKPFEPIRDNVQFDPRNIRFQNEDLATGEYITPEYVNKRIKELKAQAKERSGDGTAKFMERIKYLKMRLAQQRNREDAQERISEVWDKLSPEGQKLYEDVRDSYSKQHKEYRKALEERIEDEIADERHREAFKDVIRKIFETQQVEGPYFPLARFGDFFGVIKDANDNVVEFSKFETKDQRRKWAEERQALLNEGEIIKLGKLSDNSANAMQQVDPKYHNEVMQTLDMNKVNGPLMDEINQIYLNRLPASSMRKQFIHRKKTAGFNPDAMRAYSHNMFHGAYQLARLRHSHKMQAYLDDMDKEAAIATDTDKAKDIYNEMVKRHNWAMNPTSSPWAAKATSLGFAWYLGVTPAAAFVNTTQTWMVGLPVLGSRYGFVESAKALLQASMDFMKGGFHLDKVLTDPKEKVAFEEFKRRGLIEKTLAHDLAGVSEGGLNYSSTMHKVMTYVSFFFHHAERYNREVTAMAAFRLARKAGEAEPLEVAEELTLDSHFDYSNAERARFMQNDAAKVLLLFRQHSLNMTYRLLRDTNNAMRGESAEVKRLARRQLTGILGMTGLFAGTAGLPFMYFGADIIGSAIMGDEDEPWEFEVEFRKFLADHIGETAAHAVVHGVADVATGANISSRIGMNNLWFREADPTLEGRGLVQYYAEQALGPIAGMAFSAGTAWDIGRKGQILRGMEYALPKALKDSLRGMRYIDEGVTNIRGDALINDTSGLEEFYQIMGFTPTRISETYEQNSAIKGYEKAILYRRQLLINQYATAKRTGDRKYLQGIKREIEKFNKAQPDVEISRKTLLRSMRTRQRYSEKAQRGIQIDERLQEKLSRLNFISE